MKRSHERIVVGGDVRVVRHLLGYVESEKERIEDRKHRERKTKERARQRFNREGHNGAGFLARAAVSLARRVGVVALAAQASCGKERGSSHCKRRAIISTETNSCVD